MHILFKSSHKFTKITYIFGHKISPNKIKMIEIMQNIFVYHNIMKIEINNRKIFGKPLYIWKIFIYLEIKQQSSE